MDIISKNNIVCEEHIIVDDFMEAKDIYFESLDEMKKLSKTLENKIKQEEEKLFNYKIKSDFIRNGKYINNLIVCDMHNNANIIFDMIKKCFDKNEIKNIQTYNRGYELNLLNGMVFRIIIPTNDNNCIRGCRYDRIFYNSNVDKDILNYVFKPMLLKYSILVEILDLATWKITEYI